MKTTKDNFIYKIVTDKAKEIFTSGLFELYALHNDESESLINTFGELNSHLENGLEIAIEVGHFEPNKNNQPIFWSVEDFEARAESNFNDLKEYNPEELENINTWEELYDKSKFAEELEKMINSHDANFGITWETLDEYIGNCEIKSDLNAN